PGEPPPPDAPLEEEEKPKGIFLGHAIASFRKKGITADEPVKDVYVLERGDEVVITTVKGARLAPAPGLFVVTDYFKSEMSEYDGNYVFVSKKKLQELRGMDNGVRGCEIKLKNYDEDAEEVVKHLEAIFA